MLIQEFISILSCLLGLNCGSLSLSVFPSFLLTFIPQERSIKTPLTEIDYPPGIFIYHFYLKAGHSELFILLHVALKQPRFT